MQKSDSSRLILLLTNFIFTSSDKGIIYVSCTQSNLTFSSVKSLLERTTGHIKKQIRQSEIHFTLLSCQCTPVTSQSNQHIPL